MDGMNFSEKMEANTMTTRHHGDVCFVLRWSISFYPSDSGLTGPKSTSAQQNGQSSFHRARGYFTFDMTRYKCIRKCEMWLSNGFHVYEYSQYLIDERIFYFYGLRSKECTCYLLNEFTIAYCVYI